VDRSEKDFPESIHIQGEAAVVEYDIPDS
jgi:hypothetical protein